MIHTVILEDRFDHDFVDNHSFGFDQLAEHIRPFTPEWTEPTTRVPAGQIRSAARTYAMTKPASLQWGNGIDTSVNGFQTARALLILMGLTGNIDGRNPAPISFTAMITSTPIRERSRSSAIFAKCTRLEGGMIGYRGRPDLDGFSNRVKGSF